MVSFRRAAAIAARCFSVCAHEDPRRAAVPYDLTRAFRVHGRTELLSMPGAAPFPHPARAAGYKADGHFFPADPHYNDDRVAVFVPNGFAVAAAPDIVIFLHGWHSSLERIYREDRVVEQFIASRRDALLVVPAGPRNAEDSFGGRFEDPDGFERFLRALAAELRRRGLMTGTAFRSVLIAAYSGGYRAAAHMIQNSVNVPEVWLFDALYGYRARFHEWALVPSHRFVSVFTESAGTLDQNMAMMAELREEGIGLLLLDVPEDLIFFSSSRVVFARTTAAHRRSFRDEHLLYECLVGSSLRVLAPTGGDNRN